LVKEVAVFTQVRAHCVSPEGQAAWQAPPEQTWVAVHAMSQDPQWLASALTSTHWPWQLGPAGQALVQVPSAQAVPPGQTVPSAPQLFELDRKATQA
jgi:hypothetical protein